VLSYLFILQSYTTESLLRFFELSKTACRSVISVIRLNKLTKSTKNQSSNRAPYNTRFVKHMNPKAIRFANARYTFYLCILIYYLIIQFAKLHSNKLCCN